MKKLIVTLLISLLFTGCTDIFNNETTVTIRIADGARTLPEATVTNFELLIARPDIVERETYFGFDTYLYYDDDGTYTLYEGDEAANLEETTLSDIDFDDSVIRYISTTENTLSFDIQTGITKLFLIRVTDSDGDVYTGGGKRTIQPHTDVVEFEISKSSYSSANDQFIQWDAEIDSNSDI